MAMQARLIMGLLAAACGLSVLLSFSQSHDLLTSTASHEHRPPPIDARLERLLRAFPEEAKALERRLLKLEEGIAAAAAETGGAAPAPGGLQVEASAAKEPAPAPPAPPAQATAAPAQAGTTRASSAATPEKPWRQDKKCRGRVPPLADGREVGCDPQGDAPCCSALGWCGKSAEHCECEGCADFRTQAPTSAMMPPPPPKDHHEGKTVVVVIPFRDREQHLEKFKKYWRWFAKDGNKPPKVTRWEIYVAEQLDAKPFNRGWNFNVGVAIASGQTTASPEVTSAMGLDFDCAVIQDIDYLPEEGVDYSNCKVPIQLSAEIDRYNWKTPYVQSCGGIVGMRLKHWRVINGFGNDYFGWGGEDDELFHRLRLNNLLMGDCYPFCEKNDKWKGQPGKSIKRPPKGFGRFSGEKMHSANHTKRITDGEAYNRNLKMLEEIQKGGSRWKSDGLSNLAFRIVSWETDRTDSQQYGITYHHVRAHRGKESFDLLEVPLAVPASICGQGGEQGWSVHSLRDTGGIPWNLTALRSKLAALGAPANGNCPGAATASFVLVDRRRLLAKVLTDGDPSLLKIYFRSLGDPSQDGLIIADSRPKSAIVAALRDVGAFVAPAADYSVCTSPRGKEGLKYSVQQGPFCGNGWNKVSTFKGHASQQPGMQAVSLCDNKKYWTQRIVAGEKCQANWNNLQWEGGGTLWVPQGKSFCVGTRSDKSNSAMALSRVLQKDSCKGDRFEHDFTFDTVVEHHVLLSATVCIGLGPRGSLEVSEGGNCNAKDWRQLVRFPARTAAAAGEADRLLCVEKTDGQAGDILREGGACGPKQKLVFAVPKQSRDESGVPPAARRRTICSAPPGDVDRPRAGVGDDCEAMTGEGVVRFEAFSLLDLVAPTQGSGAGGKPLYTVVEEEIPCFPFLCDNTLRK